MSGAGRERKPTGTLYVVLFYGNGSVLIIFQKEIEFLEVLGINLFGNKLLVLQTPRRDWREPAHSAGFLLFWRKRNSLINLFSVDLIHVSDFLSTKSQMTLRK